MRAQAQYIRHPRHKVRVSSTWSGVCRSSRPRSCCPSPPDAASDLISKVLNSAVANAEHNHALDAEDLVVAEAFADEGPTLKRFRPRARGRATRIRKRTSHITIVVSDGNEEVD